MEFMKRIIFAIAAALCAAACFDVSTETYKSTYTVDTSFEYTTLSFDEVFGPDSLYFDYENGVGIGWQDLAFYHKLNGAKTDVDGGFMLSALKGSGATSGNNLYRVVSGTGLGGSSAYMVFHQSDIMPEKQVEFVSSKYGTCTMGGCYVNNTKEVADSIASRFGLGDRLSLKAVGYLNGTKTGEATVTLADFSAAKDSIVTNWTPFELTKLGQIDQVSFEIVSTKEGIPAYFCLDDMIATISIAY